MTTNGFSAAIDAGGDILAGTKVGEPALVIADLPVRTPAPTLMVLWGDWVGLGCCALLLVLTTRPLSQSWRPRAEGARARAAKPALPMRVAVLPPAVRIAAGVLRTISRAGLLGMGVALLLNEPLRSNTLAQLRIFTVCFLLPELVAWCVLKAFSAQASVLEGRLVLARGVQVLALPLGALAAVEPWRVPVPGPGVSLRLRSGQYWEYGLALPDPAAFAAALAAAGGPAAVIAPSWRRLVAPATRLDHPLAKFVLLPLALALPAFHLHQHIAYGSALGEYYSFGLAAYLSAFGLWWAAWTIGVVLGAALLRALIESAAMLAALLRPGDATGVRQGLERVGHIALYLALPGWLLFRVFGA